MSSLPPVSTKSARLQAGTSLFLRVEPEFYNLVKLKVKCPDARGGFHAGVSLFGGEVVVSVDVVGDKKTYRVEDVKGGSTQVFTIFPDARYPGKRLLDEEWEIKVDKVDCGSASVCNGLLKLGFTTKKRDGQAHLFNSSRKNLAVEFSEVKVECNRNNLPPLIAGPKPPPLFFPPKSEDEQLKAVVSEMLTLQQLFNGIKPTEDTEQLYAEKRRNTMTKLEELNLKMRELV